MDFPKDDYKTLAPALGVPDALQTAALFFIEKGNYWQNGTQFIGPQADPADAEGKKYIETSFVALPKLGELAGRHVEGVVGREPAFETVTGEAEPAKPRGDGEDPRTLKEELDETQGAWWDGNNLHETAQVFTSRLVSTLTAYFRFDIPPGVLDEVIIADGAVSVVKVTDWKTALNLIYVEVCEPGTATIYVDPRTRRKTALFSFEESVGEGADKKVLKCLQISQIVSENEQGVALESPLTLMRIVRDDGSDDAVYLDTGGVLPVIEAKFHPCVFPPFVSLANVSLNNAINSQATMAKINGDVAGFPETKHVDLVAPTEENAAGEEEEVPLETGPRSAPFLMSVTDEVVDETTRKIKNVPRRGQVIYRAPVSSQPLLDTLEFFKRALYESARQAHVLNDISANASGIARVEARADFANSLLKTKPKVEGALRQLLRGTRCLAAYLAQEGRLEQFKAARDNVTCHASSGPLTPEEKGLILQMLAAGTLSRETAMVLLGEAEDVAAELELIKKETAEAAFGEGYHPAMDGPTTNA